MDKVTFKGVEIKFTNTPFTNEVMIDIMQLVNQPAELQNALRDQDRVLAVTKNIQACHRLAKSVELEPAYTNEADGVYSMYVSYNKYSGVPNTLLYYLESMLTCGLITSYTVGKIMYYGAFVASEPTRTAL